ncbi:MULTISPECIES: hypothetical protein [unclassified Endozoicomonas]|uniref:hypothetical protein n=1 Tax=unclassified Endozoicomonas TaxID=2644528 RepID=UPI0021477805|nr:MULTISPECIES: hypothetical protein [unclassified Endozoicomonas]
MDPKVGLERNRSFAPIDNASNNQVKEQTTKQGHTVARVVPVVSSDLQWASACQQTPIRLRRYSSLDHGRNHVFKHIQDVILEKFGMTVGISKDRLVFDLTKETSELQDLYFETGQYHALIGSVLDGTDIPDLIRAERLIPVVLKGDGKKQLIIELKDAPEAYVHSLDGEEKPLKTLPITPFCNPQALNDVDTSMLRVDMFELGFTDGSPRYIFTTGLASCICFALFDKAQNKVLLCHFGALDFSPKNLSEVFGFCDGQEMRNLECHIVGGYYKYLGIKNGFLSLIDFISSKGVPIKQMFVGDTEDRPKSVVIDTRDMSLYGLPFSGLEYSTDIFERNISKNKLIRIATMPLLMKNHSLSLFTSGLGS